MQIQAVERRASARRDVRAPHQHVSDGTVTLRWYRWKLRPMTALLPHLHSLTPTLRLTQTLTRLLTRSPTHRGRRLVGWFASNWPRMVMLIMSLNGLERCAEQTYAHSNT